MKRSLLISCLGLLFTSGCSEPVTQQECDELLARYTEKVIDQARPSTGKAERSELVRKAAEMAKIDPEFASCTDRVSRAELECAMQAHNADQIERCLL